MYESITVPRVKDTKNYAKFEIPFDRDSNKPALSAAIYIPLDAADGLTSVTVSAVRTQPRLLRTKRRA